MPPDLRVGLRGSAPWIVSKWLALGVLFFFVLSSAAWGRTATVQWDANTDETLLGYRIYAGTNTVDLVPVVEIGQQTSVDISGLNIGSTYYFMVLAVAVTGDTSQPSDLISYTVVDTTTPTSTTSTVSTPVAQSASLMVGTGGSITATLVGVDPENDPLYYTIVASPLHGSLTGTPPLVTYRPNLNYAGFDNFSFMVSDGRNVSSPATVVVTVIPGYTGSSTGSSTGSTTTPNTAPVATAASAVVAEDGSVAIVLSGTDAERDALTFAVAVQPTHGTLTGTAPNLVYRPGLNYNGADSFSFTANDGKATSSSALVSITVTSVNDMPFATGRSVSVAEDGSVAITLSGGDVDGDTVTYAVAQGPSNGTLTGTLPNLTYRPNANYYGNDSFTFTGADGRLTSAPAVVSITVTPVNDAPVAIGSSVAVNRNASVAITLAGSDIEGSALTYAVTAAPTNGTLSGTAPNLVYTPATNFIGSDSIRFTVGDGALTSAAATVGISVQPVNRAPTAAPLATSVVEDGSVSITLSGTDPDGDALAYLVTTAPTKGTLSGTAPNMVYRPSTNFNGVDSFVYVVRDATLTSTPATVAIAVSPMNDAPVAIPMAVTTSEDGSISIVLVGTDADGGVLTYSVASSPGRGTLTGTAPNLTYTPSPNFNGTDAFTFTVRDGSLTSVAAIVSIAVTPVNDAPVAAAKSVTVAEDGAVAVALSGTDIEGSPLTCTITSQPANGTLSGTLPNITYTPRPDFFGADSFAYSVNDGTVSSASANVSIVVTPVNDAPIAAAKSITVSEDGSVAVTLSGTDLEGSPLSYTITSQPANGTLSGTLPNLTYTPRRDFFGADSFAYSVSDGTASSPAVTVAISVIPVNDPPVAAAQSVTVDEDREVAILLSGTDVEGGALSYTIITAPTNGALVGDGPNWVYRPTTNYNGPDEFSYTVSDGSATSVVAAVGITVASVNDAPVAIGRSLVVSGSGPQPATVSAMDVDGDPLTYSVVTGPTHGTLSGTGPNYVYTPAAGYSGTDGFSFAVSDGKLPSLPAPVGITVISSNQPPTATPANVTVAEDGAVSIVLVGRDPESAPLTYAVETAPLNGILSGTAPNLVYRPKTNFFGADSFTFSVSDGTMRSSAASVQIVVTAVNDAPKAVASWFTVAENSSVAFMPTATDVDNTSLTYTILARPRNGTVTSSGASWTYRPNAYYCGMDSLTFTASDGSLTSLSSTVYFVVTPVNYPPVATAQTVSLPGDRSSAIVLVGTDPDKDPLAYAIGVLPTNGVLSGTAPNLTYLPNPGFRGADSFTFTVRDSQGLVSSPARVSISVISAATAARSVVVSRAGHTSRLSDGASTVKVGGLLGTVGQGPLTLVRAPRNGTVQIDSDGSFTYEHDGGEALEDSFCYSEGGGPEKEMRVDVFRVLDVQTRHGGAVAVEFSVVPGLRYRVESALVVAEGDLDWTTRADFLADSVGNAEVTLRDCALAVDQIFRVRCVLADSELVSETWLLQGVEGGLELK